MGIRARLGHWIRMPQQWLSNSFPRAAAGLATAFLLARLSFRLLARKAASCFSLSGSGRKARRPPAREDAYGWVLLWMLGRIEGLRDALGGTRPVQGNLLRTLSMIGGRLSAKGRLALAEKFIEAASRSLHRNSTIRFDLMRTLAINRFMQGKVREAEPCFAEVAETKQILRFRSEVPRNVRFLADSWFVALGHVAMIELLIKKQKLGWEDAATVYASTKDLRSVPGQTLLRELSRLGIRFFWPENIKPVFDRLVEEQIRRPSHGGNDWSDEARSAESNGSPSSDVPERPSLRKWDYLEDLERVSLIEEFWEWYFPDGKALYFGPAAAKIQNQWEAEHRPPLLARSAESNEALALLRRQLGIPGSGWYACLHVRQGGFHGAWNNVWEQARDATIETYTEAIRAIVERGGTVVRMGDPTMPPLRPSEGVIDYAHSDFKSENADVLLLSGTRFFVGTNSGLSVVPGIYGVPCVLTNWVPIGIPNWFGRDLVIPKLLRRKASGEYVRLDEMLGTRLGYIQNPQDLPESLEFVDNTPQELKAQVEQMLAELEGEDSRLRDPALEEAYFALAVRLGSYRGSRIGTAFMRKHGSALGFSWAPAAGSDATTSSGVGEPSPATPDPESRA